MIMFKTSGLIVGQPASNALQCDVV